MSGRATCVVHPAVDRGVRRSHRVPGLGHVEDLWWETADGDWPSPPDDLDAAAVALQPKARRRARDLRLAGRVAWSRLANLEEQQDVWYRWDPERWTRVSLVADETVTDEVPPGRDALVALSGGVDACYTLVANLEGLLGHRSLRPRRAAFVVGMDIDVDATDAAAVAMHHVAAVAAAFGVELVTVRTNWRRDWCPSYPMSFLSGLVGALRAVVRPRESILVSGGATYENLPLHSQHPVTDHLLGEDEHPVVTTGFGADRIDKCRVVGRHEVIREHVRVCWQADAGGDNCGRCEKCVRTKLSFAAAGVGVVPALGPVTPDEVAAIALPTPLSADLLSEVLRHEDDLGPMLTRAVRERLGR